MANSTSYDLGTVIVSPPNSSVTGGTLNKGSGNYNFIGSYNYISSNQFNLGFDITGAADSSHNVIFSASVLNDYYNTGNFTPGSIFELLIGSDNPSSGLTYYAAQGHYYTYSLSSSISASLTPGHYWLELIPRGIGAGEVNAHYKFSLDATGISDGDYKKLALDALDKAFKKPGDISLEDRIQIARADILHLRDTDSTNIEYRDAEYYLIGVLAGATKDPQTLALSTAGLPVYNALKSITSYIGLPDIMRADKDKPNSPPGGYEAIWEGLKDGYNLKDPATNKIPVPTETHGMSLHGYISGAFIFADANGNRQFDAGEASTTTNTDGSFTLSNPLGTLFSVGGTDKETGLPIKGVLLADLNSKIVSPLTTISAEYGYKLGLGIDQTDNIIKRAFSISSGLSVGSSDYIAAAKAGDPSAYLAAVKVYDAATLVGAVGGGSVNDGLAAIEALLSTATGPVNLSDPATVATLLAARPGLNAATITTLATTIAGTISAIDTAVQGKSGDALIAAASAVERVAEGVEAQALAAAGTSLTALAAAANRYTGQHLTDAITLAATQLPAAGSSSITLVPATASAIAGQSATGSAGVSGTGALAGDPAASGGRLSVSAVDRGSLGQPVAGAYGHLTLNADGSYRYVADNLLAISGAQAAAHVFTNLQLTGVPSTDIALIRAAASAVPLHDQFNFTVNDDQGRTATTTLDVAVTVQNQGTPNTDLTLPGPGSATTVVHYNADGLIISVTQTNLDGSVDALSYSVTPAGRLIETETHLPAPDGSSGSGSPGSGGGGGAGMPTLPTTDAGGTTIGAPDPTHAVYFGTTVHDTTSPGGEVYALYHALLGRDPDTLGMEISAVVLQTGMTPADLAQALIASPEYQHSHAGQSNTAFVQDLYRTLLHRDADPSGLATFTDELGHGVSQGQVAVQFITSAEAQAVLHDGLSAGVFVPDAAAAAVARLYHGVLGRAPDVGGLQAFEAAAHAGTPLATLAQGLIGSSEYVSTHVGQSDQQFVEGLYTHALGRAADTGGEQTWLSALAHGASRADVAVGIVQSPEAQLHLLGQIEQGWHLS